MLATLMAAAAVMCVVQDIDAGGIKGYVVRPAGPGKYAGVLYVHWLGHVRSNRSQFLEEAVRLAPQGAVSLLVDAMWSAPKWFRTRDPEKDYENSMQQVRDLRRALDVLLAQPGVDPKRIAYCGHDFGAMYGAVLSSVDRRPRAWALQAGTTSFSHWYLLGRKLSEEQRARVVERLAPLDPVRFIGSTAPAPVLLQFANRDEYVPPERAREFADAAREPKRVLWYEAGHDLNQQAVEDRIAWLREQLGLTVVER